MDKTSFFHSSVDDLTPTYIWAALRRLSGLQSGEGRDRDHEQRKLNRAGSEELGAELEGKFDPNTM